MHADIIQESTNYASTNMNLNTEKLMK